MTTTRETADHAELAANAHIRNLRLAAGRDFAVSGYADGLIVEQDMRGMLLAAAEAFDALLSEIAALRGSLSKANSGFEEYERKFYLEQDAREQAERQRDEAVGLLRMVRYPSGLVDRIAKFLANQGADQ